MPQNRKFPKQVSAIKTARKICCLFLAVVMTVMMMPLTAWAAETGGELNCTHVHDASCGYSSEALTACSHQHTDECYTLSTGNTGAQLNASSAESEASTAGGSSSSVAGSETSSSSSTAGGSSSSTAGSTESSSSSTESGSSSSSAAADSQSAAACTCGAAEGAAHQEGCPLYKEPTCTCGASEGEEHQPDCPLYTEMPMAAFSMLGASGSSNPIGSAAAASPAPESTTDVVQISTNKYEVTTRLYMDKAAATPQDVVLVIENSTATYAPMQDIADVSNYLVDEIYKNPNSRVAVISFKEGARIETFTDSSQTSRGFSQDKNEVKAAIQRIGTHPNNASGDTSPQLGLHKAYELLSGSSSSVNVITIATGSSTRAVHLKGSAWKAAFQTDRTQKLWCDWAPNQDNPSKPTVPMEAFDYAYTATYGSTSSYGIALEPTQAYVATLSLINAPLAESNYLRNIGSTMYSIWFNESGYSPSWAESSMRYIATGSLTGSERYYTVKRYQPISVKDQFKASFTDIAGKITADAFTQGSVSELIAPGWRLDESFTPTAVSSTYIATGSSGSKNITWTIPKIAASTKGVAGLKYNSDNVLYAELKYRIIVEDTTKAQLPGYSSLKDPANDTTKYPVINSSQSVSYTNSLGAAASMQLSDNPQLAITTQTPALSAVLTVSTAISGTAEPESKINIAFPNNNTAFATADSASGSFSVQIPTGVTLAQGDKVTAAAKYGDKLTSPAAEVIVTQPVPGALKVTKTVRGTAADVSKAFAFTLTLKNNGVKDAALTLPYTGQDVPNGSLTANAAGVYTFSLSSGQGISISGIPIGYTYEITEDKGSYVQTFESGSSGTSGSIDVNDKTVSFVNTLNFIVPTGIAQDYLPYLFIVLAAIAWLAVWRKAKRNSDNHTKHS